MMYKICVINGPNMNLLGVREPSVYGRKTYDELITYIKDYADTKGVTCRFFQSNHEGAIIDELQSCLGRFDGIILNPAGYTHTSVAIADAVCAVGLPTVEVHISDVSNREPFRKVSYVRPHCIATVAGEGFDGYLKAIDLLLERLCQEEKHD